MLIALLFSERFLGYAKIITGSHKDKSSLSQKAFI
jgi:hypothetical protein